MKYKKTLNNNVVIAGDDQDNEHIVVGRGISFGLKKGDEIPSSKIERIFSSDQNKSKLQRLVEEIPQEYFSLAEEIIVYAQSVLKRELSDMIYISLADHIHFVKERLEKGFLPENSLKWEICHYYPQEFKIGKKAAELLEEEFGAALNDDESASIAMHIVNAGLGNDLHESMKHVHLMDRIMQILRYQLNLSESEDDFNYQRLIIHVKFFVRRILTGKSTQESSQMFQIVKLTYPEACGVAEKVRTYVEIKEKRPVSDEEIAYLTVHIERLRSRQN